MMPVMCPLEFRVRAVDEREQNKKKRLTFQGPKGCLCARLSMYREIFRQARVWEKVDEREHIRAEARMLFRKNQSVSDAGQIRAHIHEAQMRMDLALHYRIYAARLPHIQKGTSEHDPESVRRDRQNADYMKSMDLW